MKNFQHKYLILFYILFTIIFLIFERMPDSYLLWRVVSKSLIMFVLLVFFVLNTFHVPFRFKFGMILAIILGLSGDLNLALVPVDSLFFLAGLGSFLFGHIAYILIFTRINIQQSYLKLNPILPVVFLIYGIALIVYLFPDLIEMKIPVIVYMITILAMVLSALNLKNNIPKQVFRFLFWGAFSFVVSDSILSVNLFKGAFPLARELNMLTYTLGQFLIVAGYILYLQNRQSSRYN